MGARKIFYPITDDTLTGVLDDFDVVLKGMISCQNTGLKGIMPNSNVVLNGNLMNPETVLPGVTDIFPYTEYLTLRGSFVVAAQELLLTLMRSIELAGGIALDCSEVSASDIKSAGDLSNALILSSIVKTAMRKAVEANISIAFAQNAEIAICKSIGHVSESLCMSGDISEITATLIQRVIASLVFDGEIIEMSLRKNVGDLEGGITLSDALNLTLAKSVSPQDANLFIDGEMEVQSVRYRKLGDLAGLTLGDLSTWTMNEFYYKEE